MGVLQNNATEQNQKFDHINLIFRVNHQTETKPCETHYFTDRKALLQSAGQRSLCKYINRETLYIYKLLEIHGAFRPSF